MDNIVDVLQRLGFGEYEARAYVALLGKSDLNGYELARASSLPRANVYSVLARLEERGAVRRLDTPSGARYSAVPPSELTGTLDRKFNRDLEAARRSLQEMSAPTEREPVWNTAGYEVLLEQARTLIETASESLLLALCPQEAEALAPSTAGAEARGVRVVTLCLEACPHDCGHCRGRTYRYRTAPEHPTRWLMIVAGGEEMLAGEISARSDATAVRTRQRLLVQMAAGYILNSIALTVVVEHLGDDLRAFLPAPVISGLGDLAPDTFTGGGLEQLRHIAGLMENE